MYSSRADTRCELFQCSRGTWAGVGGVGYSVGVWDRETHAMEMEMERVSNKDCSAYTCTSRRFTAYNTNGLRNMEHFRYRGRVLLYNDNDALTM
jgi:hypothetical protein